MRRHLRKSLKRNKIRRSQFKPGHPYLHVRESVGVIFSESRDTSETPIPLTSTSRLNFQMCCPSQPVVSPVILLVLLPTDSDQEKTRNIVK